MTSPFSKTYSDELFVTYHQNPTVEVRNQLVRIHTGLVRKIAHRFKHQCRAEFEDLEQVGYIGLIRAIERFNPKYGCAFSSFAVPYIRGEILHFLRDRGNMLKVPRRWQELQRKGQELRETIVKETGHHPSNAEIARALGVSLQEWLDACLAMQNRSPLSLDSTITHSLDASLKLGDALADPVQQMQQSWQEDCQQLQSTLDTALDTLEPQQRMAIEFVYRKGCTRQAASEQMGVSPMTVSRRIKAGLQQLLTILQPQLSP
jgi:RNA polymerase sigma-B factor